MRFHPSVCLLIPIISLVSSLPQSHHDTLIFGSPESVGLLGQPFKDLEAAIAGYDVAKNYGSHTYNQVHPIEPGASVLVGHNGLIVSDFAVGYSNLYKTVDGIELDDSDKISAQTNTIYDVASLTKLFTTVAALIQIDKGTLDINEKVATYLPYFATNNKENVTILQLMTHTSGFDADPSPPLFSNYYQTLEERRYAIAMQYLKDEPGSVYRYSDLNYMNLQLVLETITGWPLQQLIGDFTNKLGMFETYFNADNRDPTQFGFYNRIATEEFQIDVMGPQEPQRPQPVRGTVHDENAWALKGVSGHAGLFSTTGDTAKLCQMILNNGTYNGHYFFSEQTADLIFHNYNTNFPGNEHGLGFELNQYYWSGPMQSLQTAGHTGFTGTTLAIDRSSNTFFLLFANRVHPSRTWSSNNIAREALGYYVAQALGRNVTYPL